MGVIRKMTGGLGPPDPPRATRMNRLAVVVAAGALSLTLVVAALMIGTQQEQATEASEEQEQAMRLPQGPGSPGFLDRPPQEQGTEEVDDPLSSSTTGTSAYTTPSGAAGSAGAYSAADLYPYQAYAVPPPYGGDDYYGYASSAEASEPPSPEEEAFARALRSSLTLQGANTLGASASGAGAAGPGTGAEATSAGLSGELTAYSDMLTRAQQMMATAGGAPATGPAEEAPGGPAAMRHEPFRQAAAAARAGRSNYLAATVQYPISRYEVREGTLIEAFLITGIHSDLPGEVAAQVSRNVYDSETQQTLLIPKGTRLIGTYDSQVALDESRLLVAWTRMIFPDGQSVDLPGLGAKDLSGASGLTGHVNRHYWRAFGNAMMLSVVGAGLALSQRRDRSGISAFPSPGEVAAGAVGAELSRVATEILRASVGRRPTIRIREGTAFTVFMNGDLALEPYQPWGRAR